MTVRTLHPEYQAASARWKRCRDAAEGQDALRTGGEQYLPRLIDQTQQSYDAYLRRATYFNATWRTIAGLVGMLFRKPEERTVPDALLPLLDDVTGNGQSLHVFAKDLCEEAFTVGRVAILVDHPPQPVDIGVMTIARAQQLGMRPTLKKYCAEHITNWRTASINNVHQLVMVTLKEQAEIRQSEFVTVNEDRWRVLDLIPNADETALVYRQRVFRVNKDNDKDELVEGPFYPTMNGKPLDKLPFWILGVDKVTPHVQTPPLTDLVDLNLAHFCVSADYEHGCHMTGLPTPIVTGYTPVDPTEKLYIGSSSAWVFREPNANAFFLEFKGDGLKSLEQNLQNKEKQMATIGARLLEPQKRMVESAETAAIHANGETSVLASIAQTLSSAMKAALTVFAAWTNIPGKIDYDIPRDFLPKGVDAALIRELVAAWQGGAISHETLFDNLQGGEFIEQDRAFEDEIAAIANNPPGAAGLVPPSARMPSAKAPSNPVGEPA